MKYLDELREMNLPSHRYAIYGSGPLAIRGIRENRDIDIVVDDALYEELIKKYPEDNNKKEIKYKNIEIFCSSKSLIDDPDKAIAQAEMIDGFKFIRLNELIKWKKKFGRPKDLKDIKLIKSYLKKQKN